MIGNYKFSVFLRVDDQARLHAAACKRMLEEDAEDGFYPIDPVARTNEILGTADNPDINACLIMMLDPVSLDGCSIDQSQAELEDD